MDTSSDHPSQVYFTRDVYDNTTLYVLLDAINSYPGDISAAFQAIAYSKPYEAYLPFPGNSGTISGGLSPVDKSKSTQTGFITWTKTNVTTDTYQVYFLANSTDGQFSPAKTGFYTGNGCATTRSMTPMTEKVTVVDNQNGTMTANFDSLTPGSPFTVNVVATNSFGLTAAYNRVTLNGRASGLAPHGALALVVAATILLLALF
eukprot:TRINITY_DN989_c0_g1_i2.p1 TRINITY_DN989_c0_g1~~TRINITY_DN989_c0_g1_i2.p1  ORF type:complete len:204 (-),score=50.32 TRINITY_DN989_c0_g1_i2:76-687(-)